MGVFFAMFRLQLMLFLIMAAGVFAAKKGIMPESAQKSLSDLLIDIILPCNIISSFNIKLTPKLIASSGVVLLVSFAVQLLYLLYSRLFFQKSEARRSVVMQYATICSNAGFLGLPIAGGVYGAEGTLYVSIALIPLRVFMWSSGLSLFTKTTRRDVVRTLLTHPCIIAVFIGFGVLLTPVKPPSFLMQTIVTVGNCTTAVSMLVIGGILAGIKPSKIFDRDVCWFCPFRLLFIPLSVWGILHFLPVDPLVRGITVLLAAMPAGSTTAILAAKYGGDAPFASRVIFASTLLSFVTLPLISVLP